MSARSFFKVNTPYLFLLITAVVGFWQVASMQYCLKYDMIDIIYPWRYFASECLKNGLLPIWNPYQYLGYPIGADPASWYPVAWIIGFFHGYDIYAISFEFVLHIFLAGIGMYQLLRFLGHEARISLIIAMAYMMSGFMVGNAQHFSWVVSATWLPFILRYYLALGMQGNLLNVFRLSFFSFLFITGGYLAFALILGYLLLTLYIFFLIRFLRNKNRTEALRYTALNLLTPALVVMLSAIPLVAFSSILPFMDRGGGVTLAQAQFCPLSPQSLVSLISPFSVVRDMEFFDTDLSTSNFYLGLIPLVFVVMFLLTRPGKPLIILIFLFGLVCFLASLGRYLPVREWLYDYVPMMNMFRFSSIFRLFALTSFLVAAGFTMNEYVKEERSKKSKPLLILIIALIVLTGSLVVWQYLAHPFSLPSFFRNELLVFSISSTRHQHLVFQGLIQVTVLMVILWLYLAYREKTFHRVLLWIVLADLTIATWLNTPYTVYYREFKTGPVKEFSRSFPQGFPIPSMRPLNQVRDEGNGFGPLWRNMHMFRKDIAPDGINPYVFKSQQMLMDTFPNIYRALLVNPPVYIAGRLIPEDSMKFFNNLSLLPSRSVFLPGNMLHEIPVTPAAAEPGDSVWFASFNPGGMVIKTRYQEAGMVVILQNHFPGWKATVDNRPANIMKVNTSFMGISVPAGDHEIRLEMKPAGYLAALFITASSLLLVLCGMMIPVFRRNLSLLIRLK
ncbi:MAG: YfhO family protein [Bacteroidetes bacterium]|nr:YfhO family protein [Bacteroidota bacterium]